MTHTCGNVALLKIQDPGAICLTEHAGISISYSFSLGVVVGVVRFERGPTWPTLRWIGSTVGLGDWSVQQVVEL